MQIIDHYNNCPDLAQNGVLAIGNFDGIHLGHQKIIQFSKDLAKKYQSKSILMTFDPHPAILLAKKSPNQVNLISLPEKVTLLENAGLDFLLLQKFDQDFANIQAEDFVKEILVKALKIKHLVVGYDFIFGKNRRGNLDFLKQAAQKYDFNLDVIDKQQNQQQISYSSSKIRQFLTQGQIKSVNELLGRNYKISGKVQIGQQIGRTIGFPTANIELNPDIILPKFGVYAVQSQINNKPYYGAANFGIKPSINQNNLPTFEVHFFDLNQDLYGQNLEIELLDFVRNEQKFSNLEELKAQIAADIQYCKKQLNHY